jgi:hypothetical protein
MSKQKLTDFTLPTDAYASFDAVSLKALIKERLDETSLFTDQNYEGSNLSSLIDIIAYSYHVLLFYLNQTSTEALFSEAELYENMNRIVKSLDYKPVGSQTSSLAFKVNATSSLSEGTYTIPRYSSFDANGNTYSFREDVTFSKTQASVQELTDLSDHYLLYQGKFQEYPLGSAIGEPFETFTLIPGDDIIIDHFGIDVYVKDVNTSTWERWDRTSSLFLNGPADKKCEIRYNENQRYELKFGNNTNGKKLNAGDTIAVYYLKSDASNGQVGVGALDDALLVQLHTVQFTEIFNAVKDENIDYITDSQITTLQFSNINASSLYYGGETVSDIRSRAPDTFSSQYRLITKSDYETYILQTFSNIIKDVKVVNNWDHIDGHMKYLTDTIKLNSSLKDPNTLYNQVTFADSCDFNNVYIYGIPKLEKTSSAIIRANYLAAAQKSAIINDLRSTKALTTETIVMDPVYIAVDLGAKTGSEDLTSDVAATTNLQLERDLNSARSFESIKNNAYSIIKNYFNNFVLGQTISTTDLVADLLNITGVKTIKTVRTDVALEVDGLSLLVWNPVYPHDDITITSANVTLPYFKYAYLSDPTGFLDKIVVVSEATSTGSAEY